MTVTHEERIAPPPGVPDRGVTRTASRVERRYQEKFLICDDCGAIWSHRNVSTYEGMDRAVWDSAVEPQQFEAAIAGWLDMASRPNTTLSSYFGGLQWRVQADEIDLEACVQNAEYWWGIGRIRRRGLRMHEELQQYRRQHPCPRGYCPS